MPDASLSGELTPHLSDVKEFDIKMEQGCTSGPWVPEPSWLLFRLRFLGEELREIGMALGIVIDVTCTQVADATALVGEDRVEALSDALDGFVDLEYVLLGTVLQMGYGAVYDEAWRRVHEKNMLKEIGVKPSRGYFKDVIKPPGWTPPDLQDLVT